MAINYYQPGVGTNSTPIGLSNWSSLKKETLLIANGSTGSRIIYPFSEAALGARWPWGQVPLHLGSSIPWSAQLQPRSSLPWKVCYSSQRGAGWQRQKSWTLVPDSFLLMQMRMPSPHSLIGPKAQWPEQSHSGWSELHSSDWMGKASVLLMEQDFRKPLHIRVGSAVRNIMQAVYTEASENSEQ